MRPFPKCQDTKAGSEREIADRLSVALTAVLPFRVNCPPPLPAVCSMEPHKPSPDFTLLFNLAPTSPSQSPLRSLPFGNPS